MYSISALDGGEW